jgi:hypothetical protein
MVKKGKIRAAIADFPNERTAFEIKHNIIRETYKLQGLIFEENENPT